MAGYAEQTYSATYGSPSFRVNLCRVATIPCGGRGCEQSAPPDDQRIGRQEEPTQGMVATRGWFSLKDVDPNLFQGNVYARSKHAQYSANRGLYLSGGVSPSRCDATRRNRGRTDCSVRRWRIAAVADRQSDQSSGVCAR